MKLFKKDSGHTLVEIVLVSGLVGVLLLLLWTNYLSVHRTYIKASTKAKNLEEARFVINFITDNFQQYESEGCQVIVKETGLEIEDNEEGTVKEIIFGTGSNKIIYDAINKKLTLYTHPTSNEISSEVRDFKVKRNNELLDFTLIVEKMGNGVVADQSIQVETTVTLQYTDNSP